MEQWDRRTERNCSDGAARHQAESTARRARWSDMSRKLTAATVLLPGLLVGCAPELPTASRDSWQFPEDAEGIGAAFIAGSGFEARELSDDQRERLKRGHERRRAAIEKELAGLDREGIWGEYGGIHSHFTLHIAPKSGVASTFFEPRWHDDLNYGRVVRTEDRTLYLDLVLDPAYNRAIYHAYLGQPLMSSTWCIVNWGELDYLIPSTLLISFCNDINHAEFPMFPRKLENGGSSLFPPPREDWPRERPNVPTRYEPFLLDRRVTAAVLSIGESEWIGTSPLGRDKFLVAGEIDAGRSSGLLPGMTLKPLEGGDELEVVSLDDVTAMVRMIGSEPWNFPPVGSIVSAGQGD